eukprot:9422899-Ditylum_brightwellii.AAC.1
MLDNEYLDVDGPDYGGPRMNFLHVFLGPSSYSRKNMCNEHAHNFAAAINKCKSLAPMKEISQA